MNPKPSKDFYNRDVWIFDLDQTLYPYESSVIQQVDDRIAVYCRDFFKTDYAKAHALRADFHRQYGTTLGGLMTCAHFDAEDYLHYVHDVDYSELAPCDRLKTALENLPGRKIVYTNGSRKHAETVLDKRGLSDIFEDIHDIAAADYRAKPCVRAFQKFLTDYKIEAEKAVFFDDKRENVLTAESLGVTGAVVLEGLTPNTPAVAHERLTVYNLSKFLENFGRESV